MKIVFMGTPKFAIPALEILIENGYEISAVVTVPDKPSGRGLHLMQSDIKKYAVAHNIKVLQPEKLKSSEFISTLKELDADLFIVVAFRILPREVFTLPRLGAFNLHGSLLPQYRGAAPINHAIMNGDKITGVTTFFLEDKVDTGNIILKKSVEINSEDNAGTLHDKLSLLGAEAVLETVKVIETGNVNLAKQDDSEATPAPKIFPEDCKIDWNRTAQEIHNQIRGLSPRPAAFTSWKGKRIKVYKSLLTKNPSLSPVGKVRIEKPHLFVSASDFEIEILELQLEGKKAVSARDFINGLSEADKNNMTLE